MPAPKKPIARSEVFAGLKVATAAFGEAADCTVKALAVVTGRSYGDCLAALTAAGRKPRCGATDGQIRAAAKALGFDLQYDRDFSDNMIATYPGVHSTALKSITTHHPARFPKAWANVEPVLLFTDRHVSAFRDGGLHDWAEGRALRIKYVMRVRRIA
jgi:hypothetical protein